MIKKTIAAITSLLLAFFVTIPLGVHAGPFVNGPCDNISIDSKYTEDSVVTTVTGGEGVAGHNYYLTVKDQDTDTLLGVFNLSFLSDSQMASITIPASQLKLSKTGEGEVHSHYVYITGDNNQNCASQPVFEGWHITNAEEPPPTDDNQPSDGKGTESTGGSDVSTLLNSIEANALPNFEFRGGDVASILTALIPYILAIAGILLLVFLLYAGFQLMYSKGHPDKVAEARNKITFGIVGFAIVFTAYWLVQIIGSVLGLKGITNIFGG